MHIRPHGKRLLYGLRLRIYVGIFISGRKQEKSTYKTTQQSISMHFYLYSSPPHHHLIRSLCFRWVQFPNRNKKTTGLPVGCKVFFSYFVCE